MKFNFFNQILVLFLLSSMVSTVQLGLNKSNDSGTNKKSEATPTTTNEKVSESNSNSKETKKENKGLKLKDNLEKQEQVKKTVIKEDPNKSLYYSNSKDNSSLEKEDQKKRMERYEQIKKAAESRQEEAKKKQEEGKLKEEEEKKKQVEEEKKRQHDLKKKEEEKKKEEKKYQEEQKRKEEMKRIESDIEAIKEKNEKLAQENKRLKFEKIAEEEKKNGIDLGVSTRVNSPNNQNSMGQPIPQTQMFNRGQMNAPPFVQNPGMVRGNMIPYGMTSNYPLGMNASGVNPNDNTSMNTNREPQTDMNGNPIKPVVDQKISSENISPSKVKLIKKVRKLEKSLLTLKKEKGKSIKKLKGDKKKLKLKLKEIDVRKYAKINERMNQYNNSTRIYNKTSPDNKVNVINTNVYTSPQPQIRTSTIGVVQNPMAVSVQTNPSFLPPLPPTAVPMDGMPVFPNQPASLGLPAHHVRREMPTTDPNALTLHEMPITENHDLNYYYPYFYKTQILKNYQSMDFTHLKTSCRDINCRFCNMNDIDQCSECTHGYYLLNGKCLNICPPSYIADNFKKACIPTTNLPATAFKPLVYLKAFTTGSCKNSCGSVQADCSCQEACVLYGNCCSDYSMCERLTVENLGKVNVCQQTVPGCDLCEFGSTPYSCGQCRKDLMNRAGKCVAACGKKDKISTTNRMCLETHDCRVEGCGDCMLNNPSVCNSCLNGYFMYNNQCLRMCPDGWRADRINWVCLKDPIFAWYWIFPSRSSCRGRCGQDITNLSDCSCSIDCFRKGNCCQDIDENCAFA